MAITVVATAKSETANSYATLAEAETYFEGRSGASAWAGSDDTKNRALVTATNRLEQQDYFGSPTDSDQRLKWPRVGTYDSDGRYWDQDTVPRPVKEAQYEIALALLAGDLELKDSGLEAFDSLTVGPIAIDPNHGRQAGSLPRQALRLLRGLMPSAGGLTARVVRS